MGAIHLITNNEACEVEIGIYSNSSKDVRIVGYGGTGEKYFDRNVTTVGNPTVVRFGCPLSPKELKIEYTDGVFIKAHLNKLNDKVQFNPKINEFCDLAKEFSQNIKQYPPNKSYSSRSGKFLLKHTPSIVGKNGSKETPARIHKTKHYIEVSNEWFRNFTIPMRVFVLSHEFAHIFLNKNPISEQEADRNGAKLYLDMGFPVIELMYSFTKIFGDNAQTRQRAKIMYNWIKSNQ